jgi:DNA-binding GntR family transcriptional regulator
MRRTRLESTAIRRATIAEAVRLGLSAADNILEIVRMRLVENQPSGRCRFFQPGLRRSSAI